MKSLGSGPSTLPPFQRHCLDPFLRSTHRFLETEGEAIGLALDRGIEHLDRVRIVLVRKHAALRLQHEAGRLHLLADECRVDPMQRLGIASARPGGGGVVDDDVGPTGLRLQRSLGPARSRESAYGRPDRALSRRFRSARKLKTRPMGPTTSENRRVHSPPVRPVPGLVEVPAS